MQGPSRFDYEASQETKSYVSKIVLASIVAVIVIFICITCFQSDYEDLAEDSWLDNIYLNIYLWNIDVD